MNYGFREVDASFKKLISKVYTPFNDLSIIHFNPDIDWVKETYPCVAFCTLNVTPNKNMKDYNSYDIDDTHITEKPDYLKFTLMLDLRAKKAQGINELMEQWVSDVGVIRPTLDITGKNGNVKTVYMLDNTGFQNRDYVENGKTVYRRVLTCSVTVPVEMKPKEYTKVNKIIIKEVDV